MEGCLISNELLDAIPFHRLKYSKSTWKEIFIDVKKGALVETEGKLSDPHLLSDIDVQNPVKGQEIEIRPQLRTLFSEWSRFLNRGHIVTVDYGYPQQELMSPHRKGGSWMCYSRHKTNNEPLKYLGDQDITAHVDFTDVLIQGRKVEFDPALYCSQGVFLTHMGQKRIEKFLHVADAIEGHKRASAVQQLLHPETMGSTFKVFIQSKTAPLPESFQAIPNRVHRLS